MSIVSSSCVVREDQLVYTLVAVCEPQDALKKFPDDVVKNILRIPYVFKCVTSANCGLIHFTRNIQAALTSVASWIGSEKVLSPLGHGLVARYQKFFSDFCRILRFFFFSLPSKNSQVLLEGIIATTATPCTVIKNMASQLIQIETDPSAHVEKEVVARFLLSLIQQRHPLSLQSAIDALQEDDVSSKEILDRLLLSLSTVRVNSSSQKHF